MCLFLWVFSVFRERQFTNSTYLFYLMWVFAFETVLYSKLRPTNNNNSSKKTVTDGIKCIYKIHRVNLSCHSRAVNIFYTIVTILFAHSSSSSIILFPVLCVTSQCVYYGAFNKLLVCCVCVFFMFYCDFIQIQIERYDKKSLTTFGLASFVFIWKTKINT